MYIKDYGKFVNQGVEAIAPEEPTFGPNGTEIGACSTNFCPEKMFIRTIR